ncbi:TetR/AcrR family transcriptional regulator [Marinihelvus fidelis]|uniref:TetR/AcrR family transcriptional regulator n=1 Tax=Marinihelvus fidelis TaxID=2613842 RepID=A0A5N0TFS5_9GAMM|nr:TetR/AcrR family transcriptional regulator [Marinihelvus fidelis]KAA9132726.1 TetR/AcrR family transcriptional regulator [Marinihelvus fidelis]
MKPAKATTPARGRPRSQTKRIRILDAAVELFLRNGYDGASVEDIAAAAGVSRQTVYSHFGSKEGLFGLAVSTKCSSSGIDPERVDHQRPPREMLPEVARRFATLLLGDDAKQINAICTSCADSHPELGRLFFQHGPCQAKRAVADYLAAQDRAGTLVVPNPEFAAWQLLCMLKGEAQLRVQFNCEPMPAEDIDAYIDDCVAMFIRAYAP